MSKDSSEIVKKVRETELDGDLKIAVKGTGILFFGQIAGTIFGLISMMLVARSYSTGEYGFYGLGIQLGNPLAIFNIGLSSRDVFDVLGVCEDYIKITL